VETEITSDRPSQRGGLLFLPAEADANASAPAVFLRKSTREKEKIADLRLHFRKISGWCCKMKTQQLRPRVLVSYVRGPYVYAAGNVRVTFDSNIRTSLFQREFLNGALPDIIATDTPGNIILEVKYDAFLPEVIRPKGNTSLTSIANDPTTDRYSFKLEFDYYVDGQTCFSLDKLILNNNYADATNMKEALIYDMYQYLGADASLYNYAKLSVNGEYWGVYLALEAVEDSFLLRNYGVQDGELYKPDSMNIGGRGEPGGDFEADDMDFENMTPPDMDREDAPQPPDSSGERPAENFDFPDGKGGFSMSGGGADLNYTDDELDSYETIWDGEITDTTKADHKRVVTALKNISEGNALEDYMDVDNLLRYMAVHVFSVNEDSLSGMMAHNYYLYEAGGKLNLIPWDYNLALGGMGRSNDATSVVNNAIDNAFSGTTFFDTLMENETYHSQYYAYLQQLVSEYINGDGFDAFYTRVRSQIDTLVESDPTAFYSYDEYLTAAETLYQVVKLRGQSIQGQLDGTIPSTEAAQRTSDALVDASALDLSTMGYMNSGGGGGFDAPAASETRTAPDVSDGSEHAPPAGFGPSQFSGEGQNADDPQQTAEDAPASGGRPDPDSFPGSSADASAAIPTDDLLLYALSLLPLTAALLFALLYRRRPRKQ